HAHHDPPPLPPFPTRRSSDLKRGRDRAIIVADACLPAQAPLGGRHTAVGSSGASSAICPVGGAAVSSAASCVRSPVGGVPRCPRDRKSTRLNSSHVSISYAVF